MRHTGSVCNRKEPQMLKYIAVLFIFFVLSITLGAMIGTAIPSIEVRLDRFGACAGVIDLATGEKYDCGWEIGRRYTTTY